MFGPRLHLALWGVAILVFGIGDLLTTIVGIRWFGLAETNPLVIRLVGPHPSVLQTTGFKVAVLGAAVIADAAVRAYVGLPGAVIVPTLIIGIGARAVQGNVLALWLAHQRRST